MGGMGIANDCSSRRLQKVGCPVYRYGAVWLPIHAVAFGALALRILAPQRAEHGTRPFLSRAGQRFSSVGKPRLQEQIGMSGGTIVNVKILAIPAAEPGELFGPDAEIFGNRR